MIEKVIGLLCKEVLRETVYQYILHCRFYYIEEQIVNKRDKIILLYRH